MSFFPREGSFEVYFNNQIVFSKLNSGKMPDDYFELAKKIIKMAHSKYGEGLRKNSNIRKHLR